MNIDLAVNPCQDADDAGFVTGYHRDHGNKGNNNLSNPFSRRQTGFKPPHSGGGFRMLEHPFLTLLQMQ